MDVFKHFMHLHTDLSDSEIDHLLEQAQIKHINRNDYLLREGETCGHKIFVIAGLLKSFVTASDGRTYILQYSPAYTWVPDHPAGISVAAVENSTVLCWNMTGEETPAFTPASTPEEKYHEFVRNNPVLAARLPLRMIAAYLDISIRALDLIITKKRG